MRRRPLDPRREDSWAAYVPSASEPWDRPRAAHLYRRAGFLASWSDLERAIADGPSATIDRLLNGGETSLDGLPASEFEKDQDALAAQAASSGQVGLLQAAWLHRMIHTPHPLRERMTLFWHDHFATSQAKVKNLPLMWRQNAMLRTHALGSFGPLLKAVGRDPAMLIWLDATTNRKTKPNENYAREVMELFSLGRGHYTEADIREAARAFTGRFVEGDACRDVAAQHDTGEKTIFGRTKDFDGDGVAEVLLEQPACAFFLAGKLAALFINGSRPWDEGDVQPLAERLRTSNHDIADAVGMILRSRLFHDPSMRARRIKEPVELAVGAIRALEIVRPTVSTRGLATACERMGQSLFQPPNVAGWPGGEAWLSTTSLVARANFAAALIKGEGDLGRGVDVEGLAQRHGMEGPERSRKFFTELLLSEERSPVSEGESASASVVALMASPEFQVA